jgi:GNAT superfamily N-acetyltransferase
MTRPTLSITIRHPTSADATAIAALLGVLGYPTEATTIPHRLVRLNNFPAALALVAAAEGGVVGVVTAHLIPSIHDDAPVAWLTTLVIATEMQGLGVGKQLVRAAEEWSRQGGAARIAVTSGAHRLDAHRFYEILGYTKAGVRLGRSLVEP